MLKLPYRLSVGLGLLMLAARAAAHTDGPNDYLTADGKLRQRLEIVVSQPERDQTTATLYNVRPDGAWSTWSLSLRDGSWQGAVSARGRLTDAQLARLAAVLAKHELLGLRDHGTPRGNARTVTFKYGPRPAMLWPGVDERAAETDAAVRARYAGILEAVQALCRH